MLFNFSEKLNGYCALLYSDSEKGKIHDMESRKAMLEHLKGSATCYLSFPVQAHSDRVVWAQKDHAHGSSDGILSTGRKQEYISIQVADCVPIYIVDKNKGYCGLVHSGWRGTLKSIILNAVHRLEERGAILKDLHFLLGPHIHQQDYEVDYDVAVQFPDNCIRENGDKWLLSISQKIVNDLKSYGVKNKQINISDISTYSDRRCQSYRRDGNGAGRMYAFLGKDE